MSELIHYLIQHANMVLQAGADMPLTAVTTRKSGVSTAQPVEASDASRPCGSTQAEGTLGGKCAQEFRQGQLQSRPALCAIDGGGKHCSARIADHTNSALNMICIADAACRNAARRGLGAKLPNHEGWLPEMLVSYRENAA